MENEEKLAEERAKVALYKRNWRKKYPEKAKLINRKSEAKRRMTNVKLSAYIDKTTVHDFKNMLARQGIQFTPWLRYHIQKALKEENKAYIQAITERPKR